MELHVQNIRDRSMRGWVVIITGAILMMSFVVGVTSKPHDLVPIEVKARIAIGGALYIQWDRCYGV